MYEPPLTTSDPLPVPVRKKGFWFWSIWVSIPFIIFPPIIFTYLGTKAVERANEALAGQAGDASAHHLHALSEALNSALIYFSARIVIPALAVICLIVSIIFHLKQPKRLV
ncbi:MAG: hypothetical protein EOP88_13790 [Verrucomicrobiaceae bacterium]|nr:MAG: hypothetical protein EOP88_13790 [Verrucomicrobiaceae bacterium]